MSKQTPPAPTASAIGRCPTIIQIVGRPDTGSLSRTIAPTDHPLFPKNHLIYLADILYRAWVAPWFSELSKWKKNLKENKITMTYFPFTSPILFKYQYLMKCKQNFVTFNQNDLQMEFFQIYVTFFTNWPCKMAASAVTKNSENKKQTISHELPNGFGHKFCHTDAFIEFLMWKHKAGEPKHSAEFLSEELCPFIF